MSDRRPRITNRRVIFSSPWLRLVEKVVRFPWLEEEQLYHDVDTADYVAAVAWTPEGQIPLIRQYRPAIDAYTWELPAGLCETDETPAQSCQRELVEEVGFKTLETELVGQFYADTGRLNNRIFCYLARGYGPGVGFEPESGTEVSYVSLAQLRGMIADGTFPLVSHIAAIQLVFGSNGIIDAV